MSLSLSLSLLTYSNVGNLSYTNAPSPPLSSPSILGVGGTYVLACKFALSRRKGVSIDRNLNMYLFIFASIDSSKKRTSVVVKERGRDKKIETVCAHVAER